MRPLVRHRLRVLPPLVLCLPEPVLPERGSPQRAVAGLPQPVR